MKKVGIIGGLSPESTILYYRGLNAGVQKRLGGHHSAKILLASVDFGEFCNLKQKGDWDGQAAILVEEAKALDRAGVGFVIFATNTMHFAADQVAAAISVPLLHITDATAAPIKAAGFSTIGFLGTKYAMELPFWHQRLETFGITSFVPDDQQRQTVNSIIYDELTKGIVRPESQQAYREIMADMVEKGAEAIILGCTEITMLVGAADVAVPVFDTTTLHIEATLDQLFEEDRSI